jgi:hypothetical protein
MNEPLVIFLPGKARHLGFDSRLDARTIVFRNRQLIELLRYFPPEEGALCGEFNGAFGNAAKVGDMPLRWLAINPRTLGQDSRPVLNPLFYLGLFIALFALFVRGWLVAQLSLSADHVLHQFAACDTDPRRAALVHAQHQ